MAGKSMNFAKEHLKDSSLFPRCVCYTEELSHFILVLYIKNYNELKKYIIYYVSALICECKFICKLVIANETLFIFLYTDLIVENTISAVVDAKGYYLAYDLKQEKNVLKSEFCHKAIMDPENEYLLNDSLFIEFSFVIKRSKNSHSTINYSSLQSLKDITELLNDLRETYPSKMHNLIVQVGKEQYLCRKEILIKSSKVFADLLQDHHELHNKKFRVIVNDNPLFFRHVLSFINEGKLDYLDKEVMEEIYRIANILQIESLKKKCEDYFVTSLSQSNSQKILEAA